MEVIIEKPEHISTDLFEQLLKIIEEGCQVDPEGSDERIKIADLVAILLDGDIIVSTATLKNPATSYRNKVFKKANFGKFKEQYEKELGYIVTNPKYEGQGQCQRILSEFIPMLKEYKMFATTRKSAMEHVLIKFGFRKEGETYNKDLNLLLYS